MHMDSDAVYSRAPLLKVFVSSVMRGALMDDRAAAAAAVESTSMHTAWYWERDADAGPYYAPGVCLGHARTADCLLLLIEDDLSPITRNEYLEAKRHHVPRFVFLREGGTLTKRAKSFIAREQRRDIVHRRYSSTAELQAGVVKALFRYAIASQRRQQVSRAQVDPSPHSLRSVVIGDSADGAARLIAFAGSPLLDVPPDLKKVLADTALRHVPAATDLLGLYRYAAALDDAVEGVQSLIDVGDYAAEIGLQEVAAVLLALGRGLISRAPASQARSSVAAALDNATAVLALQRGLLEQADRYLAEGERHARDARDEHMTAVLLLNRTNAAIYRGQSAAARETAERALALAERLGDEVTATKVLLTLADMHLDNGDVEGAEGLLDRLEEPIRRLRVPAFTAHLRALQGQVASERGDYELASKRFGVALRAARRSDEPRRVAAAQQDLAAIAQRSGRPHLARRRYAAALITAELAHDFPRLVVLHESAARVLHQLLRFPEAVEHATAAVELGQQTGLPGGPERLALLAAVSLSAGDLETARSLLWDSIPALTSADLRMALSNAIAAARDADDDPTTIEPLIRQHFDRLSPGSRSEVLEDLSSLYLAREDAESAVNLLSEVMSLTGEEQRAWRSAMAAAELQAGPAPAVAEPFYRQSIDLAQLQGQAQVAALVRGDLAVLLGELGRHDEALAELRTTAQQAVLLGDRELLQRTRHNESETLRRLGEYQEAVTVAESALELAEDLGDEDTRASAYVALALALSSAGRDREAEQACDSALRVGEPSRSVRAAVVGAMAGVRFRAGDAAAALDLYSEAARLDRLPLHRAESLLGVCMSYAAIGDRRAHDRNLQRLVRLTQQHHLEERVSPDLTYLAQVWHERGHPRSAGRVLGVAVTLAVAGAAHSSHGSDAPAFVEMLTAAIAETFVLVARVLEEDVGPDLRHEVEAALWDLVEEQVDATDVVDYMREWLDAALSALAEADAGSAPDRGSGS